MSNKEYEQAFPTRDDNYDSKYSGPGMTLRDYFATPIMMNIFDGIGPVGDYSREERDFAYAEAATEAYAAADAMLAARAK